MWRAQATLSGNIPVESHANSKGFCFWNALKAAWFTCGPSPRPCCDWLCNPSQGKAWHGVRGKGAFKNPGTAPPAPGNCLGTRSGNILGNHHLTPELRSSEEDMSAGPSGFPLMAKLLLTILEKKGKVIWLTWASFRCSTRENSLQSQAKRTWKKTLGRREVPGEDAATRHEEKSHQSTSFLHWLHLRGSPWPVAGWEMGGIWFIAQKISFAKEKKNHTLEIFYIMGEN